MILRGWRRNSRPGPAFLSISARIDPRGRPGSQVPPPSISQVLHRSLSVNSLSFLPSLHSIHAPTRTLNRLVGHTRPCIPLQRDLATTSELQHANQHRGDGRVCARKNTWSRLPLPALPGPDGKWLGFQRVFSGGTPAEQFRREVQGCR